MNGRLGTAWLPNRIYDEIFLSFTGWQILLCESYYTKYISQLTVKSTLCKLY